MPPIRLSQLFAQPYLLLTLSPLFWSGNAIFGKAAAEVVPSFTLGFYRWAGASLIVLIICLPHMRRDWLIIRRHLGFLFLMGALGFAMFNILLYTALHYTSAINVSIEQSAGPIIIVLFSFLLFRERITWLQAVGIALSLIGVAITVTHGHLDQILSLDFNRGDVMTLAAITLYAGYSVALRWRPNMHWLSFLGTLIISSLITTTPFFAWDLAQGQHMTPGLTAFASILYIAIFPSILSQLFYARGIQLVGANRAGLFINLVPIFGALLAVVFLHEQFHFYHAQGLILVLSGIILANKTVPAVCVKHVRLNTKP